MTSLSVLVVDDEPLARERLRALLADEPGVTVVGEAANGDEAVDRVRTLAPDVMFLDVQMPERNGFEVLEALGPGATPAVVFVTAYDAYALKAFDVHALDYLLKPFDRDRFRRALERARTAAAGRASGDLQDRLGALLADLGHRRAWPERLVVRADGRAVVVKVADVDFIEAAANYVRVHAGRDVHTLRETMQALEARLDPSRFQRIHRSIIVNLDRVRAVEPYFHGDSVLKLHDGRTLTLSRTYKDRFTTALEARK